MEIIYKKEPEPIASFEIEERIAKAIIKSRILASSWWWSVGMQGYYGSNKATKQEYDKVWLGSNYTPRNGKIIIPWYAALSFDGKQTKNWSSSNVFIPKLRDILKELGLYIPSND